MQHFVNVKGCLPFRLAGALAFIVCFLLRSQGVLAELNILPEGSHIQTQNNIPKVAIVGAGIGGSFTAYNLRQLLNESAELHV